MKTIQILPALLLGAALCTASTPSAWAHGHDKHVQHVTVNVTSSGYSPSTVSVKAGQPVHMTFISKGEGCVNGIRIPALRQSIDLKRGQKKEITFTPKKGQAIAFACKMNMFKGKIVAK